MQKLRVGNMVNYVLPAGEENEGQVRPAVVVRVWSNLPPEMTDPVQLQQFTDGSNDGAAFVTGIQWRTSVVYSEEHKPGTWHWPEDNASTTEERDAMAHEAVQAASAPSEG